MVYLASSLVAFALFFAEISLLPHLTLWFSVPFLLLPFLSIISLKDRTIFPLILAGFFGLLTDAVSGNAIPVFSIAYLSVVIISKIFFGKFVSYGEFRANLITISIGIAIIYGTDLALRLTSISGFYWLLPFVFNIVFAYLLLILYIWAGRTYFAWIEKNTEERFR